MAWHLARLPTRRFKFADEARLCIWTENLWDHDLSSVHAQLPAMASTQQHIQLAKSLPPRLMRFFQKFPPPSLLQNAAPAATQSSSAAAAATATTTTESAPEQPPYHNPFQPRFNAITGRWQGPVFSLRRQADLCKLAARHGVEELLPYSIKKSGERARRREENGLRVKGTGVGQRVKGKEWERGLKGKLEERRQAMLKMPEMIQQWKQVRLFHWKKHLTKDWG